MQPSFCRVTGNEANEDLLNQAEFTTSLINNTMVLTWHGRLLSTKRCEKCFDISINEIFELTPLQITKFMSKKYSTFKLCSQEGFSKLPLPLLPLEVIQYICKINFKFLAPTFSMFRQTYLSEQLQNTLATNAIIINLMETCPKITFSILPEGKVTHNRK